MQKFVKESEDDKDSLETNCLVAMTHDDTPQLKSTLLRQVEFQPLYFTVQELANRWKITPTTLRRWRRAGRIKASFMGRGVRFAITEVERFEREAEA